MQLTCQSCGGQTATDVSLKIWCIICGRYCGSAPDANGYCSIVIDGKPRVKPFDASDTAEYKPLLAEELSQYDSEKKREEDRVWNC